MMIQLGVLSGKFYIMTGHYFRRGRNPNPGEDGFEKGKK
jgi:hypothetical protein